MCVFAFLSSFHSRFSKSDSLLKAQLWYAIFNAVNGAGNYRIQCSGTVVCTVLLSCILYILNTYVLVLSCGRDGI